MDNTVGIPNYVVSRTSEGEASFVVAEYGYSRGVIEDAKRQRRRLFFRIRVAFLLVVLFVVVLVAIADWRRRRARNEWRTPLDVAVVLVAPNADDRTPEEAALEAFRERATALEDRLAAEFVRYRPISMRPFRLRVVGPVPLAATVPRMGEGAIELAKHTLELSRWTHDIDERAGVISDHYDARIYVVARRPSTEERAFVEGESQKNGRIGVVEVELDASMVDFALIVVAHELMHTLGASDKYDADGHTHIPEGLAEPNLTPLYPQRFAEVMSRNRPVAAGREVVPTSIDELAVGLATAYEIGWSR